MTWVSYAQNYEDVVLARVFADVAEGRYIDVGAQDPRMDSVTLAFYERGWRGINIEPVAHWHALLARDRPGDGNLCLAAGAAEGTARFFEVVGSGLSTMDASFAQRHRAAGFEVIEREVPVRRLDAIWAEQGLGTAHFLKIDAEGAETAVLQGIDMDSLRPWVVLVEATEPNSRVSRHADWEGLLLGRGYHFVYGDGINRYYLADEHAALAGRFGPPTVLDDFVRREQVDQAAQLESQLGAVDALSALRATEIHSLVARIGEKDEQLLDWQGRWHTSATDAGRLLAELRQAIEREARLHDEAAAREAQLRADAEASQARLRDEAAATQAMLQEAAAAREVQLRAEAAANQAQLLDAAAASEARLRDEALARHAALQDAAAAREAVLLGELAGERQLAADLQSALAAARAQSLQLDADLSDARSRGQAMLAELAGQARHIEQVEGELAALSRRVPDLEAGLHAAAQGLQAGHAELLRHVGLIQGLQNEQARLLASRSWRLTRPLRAVNEWLGSTGQRAAGLARGLARLAPARRAAAIVLAPFPGASARIKARLYGPAAAQAAAADAPILPLSEDAERILALAPVRPARKLPGEG